MTRFRTKSADHVRPHAIVSGIVQGSTFVITPAGRPSRWADRGCQPNEMTRSKSSPRARACPAITADWLHHGPPSATVMGVQVDWAKATDEFTSFRVRYS
jgi:hypothetical protein